MDEMTVFEQRFEDRVQAFALTGVGPVDSAAVAHDVVARHAPGRAAGSSGGWHGLALDRRVWHVAVILGVLVAVLGGALLIGARLLRTPPPTVLPAVTNGWVALTVRQVDTAGVGDETDIWFAALGQEARRVIGTETDDVDELCPAFSPDGRSLAYARVDGGGASALVVADVAEEGTVADRRTFDVGDGLPPACAVWSADGNQLAFGVPLTSPINPTRSGEGSEVWVVRLSDGHVTVLPDLLATDLEWSPDGTSLALVGGVETASGEDEQNGLTDARIHLFTPRSGTFRSLDETLGVGDLTWSPDGGRIAYGSADGLRLVDPKTGRQEVLTAAYGAVHGIGPVWSPDGASIAYQRCPANPCSGERHEVVLVTPDDRSAQTGLAREVVMPQELTTTDGSSRHLFPWRITWSPDSTHLLYVAWTFTMGCCNNGTGEETWAVAVPTDPAAPAVVLADMDGIVAYGNKDYMRVPIQVWGRSPSDGGP